MVFAFAIPTHMHITMNTIISDYLPKVARGEDSMGRTSCEAGWAVTHPCMQPNARQGCRVAMSMLSFFSMHALQVACMLHARPARVGLLGASAITYLGLMKLNLAGPGITDSIRGLWRRSEPAAAKK
eukprot:365800-Chlamydomonas_euryale.AAC.39